MNEDDRRRLRTKAWYRSMLNTGAGFICPGCGRFTRRKCGMCRSCEAKARKEQA